MKKFIIIFSIILLGVIGYTLIPALTRPGKITVSYDEAKILPRVLFLTTGGLEGNGEISEGVVVAIQSFNKNGSFVWLNDREVLLEPNVLSKYSFLIIPTSIGYHDGDRKYSLTFLSDLEMQNIINWVKNGGTLIAEENIGRNTIEGDDRVNISGELNPETWKLSELFGIKMKERDLDGFSIEEKNSNIWKGKIKEPLQENEWVLVPSEIISDKLKVLAEWVNGDERIPAIIGNDYGKGKAFLLTTTYLLHPSNDGGISSIEQIENFYNYILENSDSKRKFEISLNPWPHGASSAFCISFNSLGNEEQLNRVINFLMIEKLPATFFIDSSLSPGQKNILEENKNISIQSNLFSRTDFSAATHFDVARAILMNEQNFGKAFTGLRFPYSSTNFWGLIYANDKGYIFDSSIGVDHLTSYAGSVFPYNIPVARDSYFKTLDLIEICPVKNDDIFYFIKSETEKEYTDEMQKEDALLYEKYLTDFFEHAVQQNEGLMVYTGNPQFTGFSEITMQPLKKMIATLKAKNSWITTLEEVADYRNKIKNLSVEYSETGNNLNLKINLPAKDTVKGLTFKIKSKPENIDTKNDYVTKEINDVHYLITDAKDGDEITLRFK